jgi:thiamine-monophosphate kinase
MAEKDWIAKYFAPLARNAGAAQLRDDVATLASDPKLIVTTDALVEGVHFLPSDPIDTVARKLVRVNVSDVLAKGALPQEALLTLGWPKTRSESELERFAITLGEELSVYGASLIGGDTVSSPSGVFVSLTLTGRCLGAGPVRRSTAQAGDDLWVTGTIGLAALGLAAARRGDDDMALYYRVPQISPLMLAEPVARYAHAAMDVSDGLLGDAQTLAAASGLSVHIALEAVPFPVGPRSLEERLRLATFGDDYQILLASAPDDRAIWTEINGRHRWPVTRIGHFARGEGLMVTENGTSVNLPETLGFQHG